MFVRSSKQHVSSRPCALVGTFPTLFASRGHIGHTGPAALVAVYLSVISRAHSSPARRGVARCGVAWRGAAWRSRR